MAQTKWEQAREVYTNLDPRMRLVVQIGGIVLTTWAIFKLIKYGKQLKEDKGNRNENQAVANELQVLNQNPVTKQKISSAQASAYANKIFASMNGKGTYEDEIVGIFYKLYNDADFLAVERAFGTRTILSKTWLVDDFRGTLIQCLADELDIDYTHKINEILKKKKIRYRV